MIVSSWSWDFGAAAERIELLGNLAAPIELEVSQTEQSHIP
jgi:hypothetical protein